MSNVRGQIQVFILYNYLRPEAQHRSFNSQSPKSENSNSNSNNFIVHKENHIVSSLFNQVRQKCTYKQKYDINSKLTAIN